MLRLRLSRGTVQAVLRTHFRRNLPSGFPSNDTEGFNCRVPTKLWLHRKGEMPGVPGDTGQVCVVAAESACYRQTPAEPCRADSWPPA